MPYGVTAVYFCTTGLVMSRVSTNDGYLFLQQSVTEDIMFGTSDLFYFYFNSSLDLRPSYTFGFNR